MGFPATGVTGGTGNINGGPPTGGTDEAESDIRRHARTNAPNAW
jgi:hypothetical protein